MAKASAMPYPEYRTKSVGSETQVSILTQEFEGVTLFLQGIYLRICNLQESESLQPGFQHFCPFPMDSTSFPVTLILDPVVTRFMVSAGNDSKVGNNLYTMNNGTVINGNESHLVISPPGSYPSFQQYVPVGLSGCQ